MTSRYDWSFAPPDARYTATNSSGFVEMTLPYDIARCQGRDWPECVDCLRRLAPDRPGGWQTYMVPPESRPHPAWVCDSRIVERGDERPTCDTPPAPRA